MKKNKNKSHVIIFGLLAGIFVGFLNGFFGGGGGMIVVPVLIYLFKFKDKTAHATAIMCILPLSITSSIIYITNKNVNYSNLTYTSIGVIVGGLLGALFLNKINNKALRIIFSCVMIFAGLRLISV